MRTLPNWLENRNNVFRLGQEVGPRGLEEERRLGGFQARGLIDLDVGSDRQGQDQVSPSPPRQPYDAYTPPVGCFVAPHRCLYCEDFPANIFPLHPSSMTDPDPPPHYDDLFPPDYTPFPNPNTHLCPSFSTLPNTLLPTPSFP